jgi:hypothetical protein
MTAAEFQVMTAVTAAEATNALTNREKHLVGLAVTVTRGCQACTGRRIQQKKRGRSSFLTRLVKDILKPCLARQASVDADRSNLQPEDPPLQGRPLLGGRGRG